MVLDFKLRKVKDNWRKFVTLRKTWKLHENSVKSDFRSYIIKWQKETCWWNYASNSVSEKCKLWKEWKQGNTSKRICLEAEKKTSAVYKAESTAERKRVGKVMRRDGQKGDVFTITERMVKAYLDIIIMQCMRDDDGVLVVSDEDKKILWTSYHEKLLKTECAWDRKSLSQGHTISNLPCLTDKDMVKELISKMKNGKTAGQSSIVLEMVKAAEKTGVEIITDLVNQIMVEGVIPAEMELQHYFKTVNRY